MARVNDQGNHSLASELRWLQGKFRRWSRDVQADRSRLRRQIKELQSQLERTEAERLTALIALDEERERWQHERDGLVVAILQKMGQGRPFIPDMLERLAEPNVALTSRDVLAELKRWVRDVSGQRLSRFPTKSEAPGGYIALAPDELTDFSRGFDVGNERPFAEGQAQVTFRVVRKGWRLGTQVLHPARLSAFSVEAHPMMGGEGGEL